MGTNTALGLKSSVPCKQYSKIFSTKEKSNISGQSTEIPFDFSAVLVLEKTLRIFRNV
jgi:hypothetical protein